MIPVPWKKHCLLELEYTACMMQGYIFTLYCNKPCMCSPLIGSA